MNWKQLKATLKTQKNLVSLTDIMLTVTADDLLMLDECRKFLRYLNTDDARYLYKKLNTHLEGRTL